MALRIASVVLLLISILFLPFWISIILALAGMAYFPKFWEAVVLMLISDLLYGAPMARFGGFLFVSSTVALAALIIIEGLKTKIKFYN